MAATTEPKDIKSPATDWPLEVRCLIQSLARPALVGKDRRAKDRKEHRARVKLFVVSRKQPPAPVEVYLRDFVPGAVSFVSETLLETDQLVDLEMTGQDGKPVRVRCKVGRCRQFREGWFEGVLRVTK
jgi:hypothetical protein